MRARKFPSATSRRRTQAERTELTRKKLVSGAIALLKRKRYAGFRTAEVASLAGVSQGAQTHHFPAKDMLVLQALETVYRDTQQRALNRIEKARKAPSKMLGLMVADSEEFFLGEDFLMSLDLLMVDPASPLGTEVKKLARQYRLPVEQAWLDALVDAGHPVKHVEYVVRLTYAIARGFGIRKLMSGSTADFPDLMAAWIRAAKLMLQPQPSPAVPRRTP